MAQAPGNNAVLSQENTQTEIHVDAFVFNFHSKLISPILTFTYLARIEG